MFPFTTLARAATGSAWSRSATSLARATKSFSPRAGAASSAAGGGRAQNGLPSSYALVGQPAPDFEAKSFDPASGTISDISLRKSYLGKYLVMIFYPLNFTFVCPTEITAFSDRAREFHDLDANVVAVSVDSEFAHLKWAQTPRELNGLSPLAIPLISDLSKKISRDYGVLLEPKGIALRATFLLDKTGIVKHATVNDLSIGRSVDETLRVLMALQHSEKHGEVCPVNWSKGSPGMAPTNDGVSKYFKKK